MTREKANPNLQSAPRRRVFIAFALAAGCLIPFTIGQCSHQRGYRTAFHMVMAKMGIRDIAANVKQYGMQALPPNDKLDHFVDRFGQYAGADWPGKIHDESEFSKRLAAEPKADQSNVPSADRDPYGGWLKGTHSTATGYFRTVKIAGKWWLCDPLGNPFYSVGVDAVDVGQETTMTAGREEFFQWLPKSGDPLFSHVGVAKTYRGMVPEGAAFNFYGANLERKYGSDWQNNWDDETIGRMRQWGFNTLGNWSSAELSGKDKMPYVLAMNISGDFNRVATGSDHWGKMYDPFDPKFAAAVPGRLRLVTAKAKNDPWCLGYFIDNELSWIGSDTNARYDLAYGALDEDAVGSPAKQEFMQELQAKYVEIDKLNGAWGTSFASWADLNAAYEMPSNPNDAQRGDMSAFVFAFAARYFQIVSSALKAQDPNHLYLGCRFDHPSPEILRAASEYCDVVSFNVYARRIEDQGWTGLDVYNKPFIIGEFHFGSTDRGLFGPGLFDSGSQAGRARDYQGFIGNVESNAAIVGCHWYQYTDMPVTGRIWDGENFGVGLVDVTDTPYPELTASAAKANAAIYDSRSR